MPRNADRKKSIRQYMAAHPGMTYSEAARRLAELRRSIDAPPASGMADAAARVADYRIPGAVIAGSPGAGGRADADRAAAVGEYLGVTEPPVDAETLMAHIRALPAWERRDTGISFGTDWVGDMRFSARAETDLSHGEGGITVISGMMGRGKTTAARAAVTDLARRNVPVIVWGSQIEAHRIESRPWRQESGVARPIRQPLWVEAERLGDLVATARLELADHRDGIVVVMDEVRDAAAAAVASQLAAIAGVAVLATAHADSDTNRFGIVSRPTAVHVERDRLRVIDAETGFEVSYPRRAAIA